MKSAFILASALVAPVFFSTVTFSDDSVNALITESAEGAAAYIVMGLRLCLWVLALFF